MLVPKLTQARTRNKMIKGTLTRFAYLPWGTYGKLRVALRDDYAFSCFTAECPWLFNQKMISCIPEGVYKIEKWKSPTKGPCFIISGKGVVKQSKDGEIARELCLIHGANWPDELRGCIAPGSDFGLINSNGRLWPRNLGVTSSKFTLNKMLEEFPDVWELEIVSQKAEFVNPR